MVLWSSKWMMMMMIMGVVVQSNYTRSRVTVGSRMFTVHCTLPDSSIASAVASSLLESHPWTLCWNCCCNATTSWIRCYTKGNDEIAFRFYCLRIHCSPDKNDRRRFMDDCCTQRDSDLLLLGRGHTPRWESKEGLGWAWDGRLVE